MHPLVLVVLVAIALPSGLLIHFLWPHVVWVHLPLHSTVEALGGLAAILTGLVLLARKVEWDDARLQGIASGLLGMGILEGFHAVSSPDHGFVLLRSAASLLGGRRVLVRVASAAHDRQADQGADALPRRRRDDRLRTVRRHHAPSLAPLH